MPRKKAAKKTKPEAPPPDPTKVAPGIHSLSYDLYKAADGVNKSLLDVLSEKTPFHALYYIAEQKAEFAEIQKSKRLAKDFGVLAHHALLEPDSYRDTFYVKPEKMTFATTEGKAWRAEHSDRPYVTFEEEKKITSMVSAVHLHPYAKALLTGGRTEANIFAFDHDGILRKMRIDCLTDGNIIPDVKTCADASDRAVEKAISNYRYHVQGGYYIDGCKLVEIRKDYFVLIFVESAPPFAVRCVRVLPEALEIGRDAYRRDMQLWKNCLKSGKWPAWEETYFDAGLPEWEMRQISRAQGG